VEAGKWSPLVHAALAVVVAQGLEQAAEDFPAPPLPAADLRAKLEAVNAATGAAVAAETAFREQHAAKDDAVEDLADSLKADLKYAEFAVRDLPEKLSRLGWVAPVEFLESVIGGCGS
jgi:hypothetical protein